MRILFLLSFIGSLFSNEEIATSVVNSNLPMLINGIICPTTGSLVLSEFDGEDPSICPIVIDRAYTPHEKGWRDGHYNEIDLAYDLTPRPIYLSDHTQEPDYYKYNKSLAHAVLKGAYGSTVPFRISSEGRLDLMTEVFHNGQTNLCGTEISGRTHPKNYLLQFCAPNVPLFTTGGGVVIKYGRNRGDTYYADQKRSPNGTSINYEYDSLNRITHIVSYSKTNKKLSEAKINYDHNWKRVNLSNGSNVVYEYIPGSQNIMKVFPSDGPMTEYLHDDRQRLVQKIKPDGRTVKFSYKSHGKDCHKIKTVSVPSHRDGSMAEVVNISYEADGSLKAYTPFGHYRHYFVGSGRLNAIRTMNDDNSAPYTKLQFNWAEPHGPNKGCLRSLVFRGPSDAILMSKRYIYDERGNVLEEKLYGNLTGKGTGYIGIDSKGQVITPETECYNIKKTFVPNMNLIASEEIGKLTRKIDYLPNTDIINKELIYSEGDLKERRFFEYNEDYVLIKEIVDNGSGMTKNDLTGVTERKILYKSYDNPILGLATEEKICFLNLETGEEVLSSRKEKTYDKCGRTISERYFDADDQFLYELSWGYCDRGNLIREIGALGTEIMRKYDNNRNLIYEAGPTFNKEQFFVYDKMNRLVEEREVYGDEVYITSHEYDIMSRKTQTIDRYGHATRYTYDFLGRVCEVHDADERSMKKSYHPTDFVKSITDPEGRVTTFEYTIRGKPYHIAYPDGSEEFSEYDLEGNLVKHTDQLGLKIEYAYDYRGRVTDEKHYDAQGTFLHAKRWVYNAFHLLEETDEAGNTTHYKYDFQGRLVHVERKGKEIFLSYNSQGLLAKKVTNSELFEYYTYDNIGRLIAETKVDALGNILLSAAKEYDEFGRVVAETKGDYTTHIVYNNKDELIEKILPDGRPIRYSFNHKHLNDKGETVLLVREIDPKGVIIETEHDTRCREVRLARYDTFGKLLQQSFKYYDRMDKLSRVHEEIFYQDKKERDYIITFKYDCLGRPTEIAEEKGAPHERSTFFEYDCHGQKIKTVKPNGVVIHYTYDAQGRLIHEKSTDGSIEYHVDYDEFSRPIAARDILADVTSSYAYDSDGKIVKETLMTGESVENRYDVNGRLIQVKHDRVDPIHFSYDGLYLRGVDWKGLKAKYDAYDLSGNLIKGGDTSYHYDNAARLIGWNKEKYSEAVKYDQIGNLVERTLLDKKTVYEYDSLNQLEKESGAYEKTYNYDSHYNRRMKNGSDYSVDSLNQPTAYIDAEYTWDRNGNLIMQKDASGTIEYTYDARDRLVALKQNGESTPYFWDEQNRCLKAGDTHFLYQGRSEVGSVENDTLKSFRVLGLSRGQESGAALWTLIEDHLYKPLHDLSGNLIALTDLNDNLVEKISLSAFGEPIQDKDSISPWGFCSKRREKHSNLILFGYRFYNPTLGRFITADPAGFDAGPNLFAYCNNNPLTFTDLFGLVPITYTDRERDTPDRDNRSTPAPSAERASAQEALRDSSDARRDNLGRITKSSVIPSTENTPTGISDIQSGYTKLDAITLTDCQSSWRNADSNYFSPDISLTNGNWTSYGNSFSSEATLALSQDGMQTTGSDNASSYLGAFASGFVNDLSWGTSTLVDTFTPTTSTQKGFYYAGMGVSMLASVFYGGAEVKAIGWAAKYAWKGLSHCLPAVSKVAAKAATQAKMVLGEISIGTKVQTGLTKSQLKSISSLENQIAKHRAKLAEYTKNPAIFDNKGFLKNAPNDAIREKIIQSRIDHLNQEIQTFQKNIEDIIKWSFHES